MTEGGNSLDSTPIQCVLSRTAVRRGQDVSPQGKLKGHLCHRIEFKEEMKDKKQTMTKTAKQMQ